MRCPQAKLWLPAARAVRDLGSPARPGGRRERARESEGGRQERDGKLPDGRSHQLESSRSDSAVRRWGRVKQYRWGRVKQCVVGVGPGGGWVVRWWGLAGWYAGGAYEPVGGGKRPGRALPGSPIGSRLDRFRETVSAPGAPAAIGPYSHAVRAGELLFCSGQIPLDPVSGEVVGASAAEQARRCLENLQAVCAAAGTTLEQAVRLTVYMTDLERFGEVNEVYGEFFAADPPARVTVGVVALPRGALVEIDAVVALGPGSPRGSQPSEVSGEQPLSPPPPATPLCPGGRVPRGAAPLPAQRVPLQPERRGAAGHGAGTVGGRPAVRAGGAPVGPPPGAAPVFEGPCSRRTSSRWAGAGAPRSARAAT